MKLKTLLFIKNKMLLSCLAMVLITELANSQNLSFSRRYGSTGTDAGTVVYVDGAGNSYTAGTFSNSLTFQTPGGPVTLTAAGVNNVYIIKNAFNGTLQWVKGLIGTGSASVNDIVVATNLEIYLAGNFSGIIDFDPNAGTSILGSNLNTNDIFTMKLSAGGNLIWVKKAGGEGQDYANSLALDNNGDVVIVGSADDNNSNVIDFNPDPVAVQNVSTVGRDGIIWRLDAFNGTYVGIGKYGTTNSDEVRKVKVDASGNVYVAGYFSIGGVTTLNGTGGLDAFIIKYSPTYTILWTRQFGGQYKQVIYDLDVDATGNVYSTGTYERVSDFDYLSTSPGSVLNGIISYLDDGFICKLNSAGNFQWVKPIVGTALDLPKKIEINSAGDIIVAGAFQGTTDFDPSTLTSSFTSQGGYDAFIAKYDANGNFTNNIQVFGDDSDDFLNGLAHNSGTTYYVTGSFNNIINVGSTAAPVNLTSSGLSDAFFLCYTVCSMPPTPTINTGTSTLSFCNNQSVLLQANTLPINTSVRWFANSTISSALQTSTSLSYNTPILTASTNFYVSASNTCGESARNLVSVTKNTPPNVTISGSPASVCLGQTATLTGFNANTYAWAGGPSGNKYVVTPTVTTTYTVTGTASGSGCTDVGTYTLVVKSLPGVSITTTRNGFCDGLPNNNTSLTGSGATSYLWNHNSAVTAGTIVNPGIGLTVYTLTGTNALACSSTAFITLTVNGLPTVTSAVSKPAYCTSELTFATLSGASLYRFGSGALSTNRIFSATYTTTSTNTINWLAVSTANCSVTGSFTISVVSPPVITGSISNPNTCVGITTTITRMGGTITWPNGVGLTIINATSAGINPNTTTTSFVITATGIPGCTSTENITISRILNATPTINISATQTNICSGTFVTFSGIASNTNGGTIARTWKLNGNTVGTAANYISNTLANADQITQSLTVTGTSCLVSNTANSNTITMTNASVSPSVSISAANTTICSADVASFTANITNGGSNPTITWKVGNNSFNQNNTSFTIGNISDGTIISCVITSNGSCLTTPNATSTGIVMTVRQSTALVNALPTTPSTTCGTVTYSLTATGLNNSFAWSNGFISSGNVSSIVASASGNYSATVTGTCNSVASNTNNLTVYNATQILSPFTNRTLCGGDFTTFAEPLAGNNLTYLWSNGATTPDIYTSTAGIYALTVTGSCGTAVSNTATVLVNEVTTLITQPFSSSVVAGNSATFTASATGTNISYLWNNGETTNVITTSIEGTYQVTITGTCGEIISNAVTLSTTTGCVPPSITTQPQAATVCSGLTSTIFVVADGTNLSYLWSNGALNPSITVSQAGSYAVTITGSCGTVISTLANVIACSTSSIPGCVPPSITTQPQSATVCSGLTATLTVVASGTGLSYLWSNGAISDAITTSISGNYTVTITGSCGSIVSNMATITPCSTTTSINQKGDSEIGIEVYPNPTEGNFGIKAPISSQIEVINSNGSVLKQIIATDNISQMNISQKGLLLIKITSGNNISYRKIVIE